MTNQEQIKALVLQYTEAIHSQNREDFCSLWADTPACTLISTASLFQGVENIYPEFVIDKIQAAYSQILLAVDSIQVHEIRDDLATVVFRYHTECIRRGSGEPYGIQGLETQVIIRESGQWKLLHVHYSSSKQ